MTSGVLGQVLLMAYGGTVVPEFAAIPGGVYMPLGAGYMEGYTAFSTLQTMDAAGERFAMMGFVYIDGHGTSKTISAAGGGSISFRLGTTTFANGGTTVEVGLQDVSTSAGPPSEPDGTFDVSRVLTGGGGGLTTAAWNTVSMTGGSGTKTLSTGDMVAVVLDMTARAGADSVVATGITTGTIGSATPNPQGAIPVTRARVSGSWATAGTQIGLPNALLTFDDGTLGILDSGYPWTAMGSEAFQNSTNPDERGLIFQSPWDCKVDALFVQILTNSTNADFTIAIYEDPLGTPAALASVVVLPEQLANDSVSRYCTVLLPTEVELTKATDYCIAVKATGTANITLVTASFADEDYRTFLPNGLTIAKATRNNSTGAFTAETPAVTMYKMGVRISALPSTGS